MDGTKDREGWIMVGELELEYLEKYLYEKVNICDLDTYILDPERYNELMSDDAALDKLPILRELVESRIRVAYEVKEIELYVAFIHNTHVPRSFWLPIHCMKQEDNWYQVVYNEWWFCRDCRHDNGPVLRSLLEAESGCYAGLDHFKIPLPEIFQHHRCEKCGHLLQGHLLKL